MFPFAPSPPSWILPGATAHFDFKNNRYWGAFAANSRSVTAYDRGAAVLGAGSAIWYMLNRDGLPVPTGGTAETRICIGTGLWAEGKYTNFCLQCRDHTNASWTKTTMTATKNQPSADILGASNAASSLTASGALALSLQAIVLTSGTYIFSAFVKRLVGTGTIEITLDGVTYTDITSQISSSRYTRVSSVSQNTFTAGNVGFRITTSGDSIAVDFCQCENNGYPTTPLVTTTVSVARGIDEPTFNDATNSKINDGYRILRSIICNGAPWSIFIAASGNSLTTTQMATDSTFSAGIGTNGGTASFKAATSGNTATTANNGVFGLGNVNKIACRANGATTGSSICLNGNAIVTASSGISGISAQSNGSTHIGIGNNGSGAAPLDGYFEQIAFFNKQITDGQMLEWTR